jgi:hypothetical protein
MNQDTKPRDARPYGQYAAAFAVGALFSLGLGISGMTLPEKVIGFLDITGDWDPSLAFVMGGAVLVYTIFFPLVTRRADRPRFAERFRIPTRTDLTPRLFVGAALFGAGWGLAGFCPGPALTSLASGSTDIFLFVGSMFGGMYLFRVFDTAVDRLRSDASDDDTHELVGTKIEA